MEDLTSTQITEWMAMDKIDPIGKWRDDFRTALMLSVITNLAISIHSKKGTKHTEITDFMFDWDDEEIEGGEVQTQSIDDMKKVLQAIASRQGFKKKSATSRNSRPPISIEKRKK